MPKLSAPEPRKEEIELEEPDEELAETVEVSDSNGVDEYLDPVNKEAILELDTRAKTFVKDLTTFNPNSPEYSNTLQKIQTLGYEDVISTTAASNRMLERASSSLSGSKKSGGDASNKMAVTLNDLRNTVADLSPEAQQSLSDKIIAFLPGGKKAKRYLQRYESAQGQLNHIVESLRAGKEELAQDNVSLHEEKINQWDAMGKLNKYLVLAKSLDKEIVLKIEDLRSAGNTQAADALESDMLFAVRQRTQDITTQLAVALQGYMAMELVRKNNEELIKGVDRAENTTLTALRTSLLVAQALDQQKQSLDQIDAVNEVTNKTIATTSAMLRQQTERIHAQASSSGVSVEVITKAFDDIASTIKAIDTFKGKANESMKLTIDSLTTQLERARPQLDRVRAIEMTDKNNSPLALED